ncbi:MAG: hypothetical protein MJZ38_00170 [archaeon]|nr:hypothetical protein [archaeon]
MSDSELYIALLLLPALIGAVATLLPGKKILISRISLVLCAVSCVVGALSYTAAYRLPLESMSLDIGPLVGGYSVSFDSLSTAMMSMSSIVYLLTLVHLLSCPERCEKGNCGFICLLFMAVMLAMCANSIILLLVAWEMVTLTTFLMTKGSDEVYRWRYFTITHFGGLIIMCVFGALWYLYGTCDLSAMTGLGVITDGLVSAGLILLLFIGFGTKLGLVPFHAWMPDLYSTAPVHSVTLLSTVCSNVAILLLMKSTFLWIGVPDNTYLPIVILTLAAFGSVWGAMESLIQTEPRRILAYSSMENMSMVILCLAMGILFEVEFEGDLTALMLAAAMLHTINHAFFKSLMLLNVGTIEKLTGERNIDRMGGLALFLPLLSMFALIGTLSMAAIPPMNGFVSEWLMIKTVVTAGTGTSVLNVLLPIIVAVLGVCGTMAAVSYARLYGFVFLGRPRSESMREARPMGKGLSVPLALLAAACVFLGIFAVPVVRKIAVAISDTLTVAPVDMGIVSEALDPALIAVVLALVCIVLYGLFRLFRKDKVKVSTWDCGTELNKDMQYSSEGFSQPLVRVFHPFYGDTAEVKDVRGGTDTYHIRFTEPFIRHILNPVGKAVDLLSVHVERMQSGNIQAYLAYLLVTLIVILLAVRFI